MTRFLPALFLAFAATFAISAQQAAKTTAPADDIFSGTVTASAPDSITVVRKVPAKADESRVFVVDKDTKTEGKLRVNARVSVHFKPDGDGVVHALRIIVRAEVKPVTGAGRPQVMPSK